LNDAIKRAKMKLGYLVIKLVRNWLALLKRQEQANIILTAAEGPEKKGWRLK
jgi:hypothetical protein